MSASQPRPKLALKPDRLDKVLDAIALLGLLSLWAFSAYCYKLLPEIIPTHFGATGAPDAWGSKNTLWLLAGIGTVLFGVLTVIVKIPHQYNYTQPITPFNAEREYRRGARLIRSMKAIVMFVFLLLLLLIVQTVHKAGLQFSILLLLFTLPFTPLLWYWVTTARAPEV